MYTFLKAPQDKRRLPESPEVIAEKLSVSHLRRTFQLEVYCQFFKNKKALGKPWAFQLHHFSVLQQIFAILRVCQKYESSHISISKCMNKIICHVDMDAFFASIEERNRPHLKGKPIVVGSDPKEGSGRGVVSTANYAARAYGIHSAMPISHAWKASQQAKAQGKPEAIFLPPHFENYQKSSQAVLAVIKKYSSIIEQGSIDEFYFDLSSAGTFKKAEIICKKIKAEILATEKVTCSIGIGPNKMIAKIAAGEKKPDGLFIMRQEDVEAFLEPMPVRNLPGIGPKTAELLYKKNVNFVKDLKQFSREELINMLGKWGSSMYDKARGTYDAPIAEDREAKSIGEHNTFEQDTLNVAFIGAEFQTYCRRVFERFKHSGFTTFKTIAITIRFSDFKTVSSSKSFTPPMGAGDYKPFHTQALKLLLPYLDQRKNPRLKKIRLIGVRIENFSKTLIL